MAVAFLLSLVQTLILLASCLYFVYKVVVHRRYNLPPGPQGWPLIGLVLQCCEHTHLKFHKWSQTYGDVFSVKLGVQLVVVLNSYDAIRDAFLHTSTKVADRPKQWIISRATNQKGVATLWNDWKVTRKHMIKSVNEYVVKNEGMEKIVKAECDVLEKYITNSAGKPISLRHVIYNVVGNILCTVVFSKRYNYCNDNFRTLLARVSEKAVTNTNLLTFLPLFWYIPSSKKRFFLSLESEVSSFIRDMIIERRQQLLDKEPENIIDSFLIEPDTYGDDITNLVEAAKSMFIPGIHTTSGTLLWGILYLAMNPEIQEKCYSEIVGVVGIEQHLTFQNRGNLPYVEATILEIHRCANVIPLGVPRLVNTDTNINGHIIPKGTTVIANIWANHMNEKKWSNPYKFNPDRFMGDGIANKNHVIPFSIGLRACPGQDLAKMDIFLITTRLIQKSQTFRPHYKKLVDIRSMYGGRPFLTLTATATNDIVNRILMHLHFKRTAMEVVAVVPDRSIAQCGAVYAALCNVVILLCRGKD
ncbi:cytochrome P450 2J4-like [Saccoglossus kowalevskii]|uniref:Cytochrome P450 2J6-like n=1 Tax=Saccoglossus kowalevskii TaxID=10224 RepID=A0ABM0GIA0_SACKO|nr:PREDICTED: cytochrome P450 2J6-like [Saccoglossus kowalevskii]